MGKIYRQGDVLLKRVSKIPQGAQPLETLVLAEGEATGHKHRLEGQGVQVLQVPGPAPVLYVRVPELARLVHEEHGPVEITPGEYQVVREQEYNPWAVANRQVAD